MLQNIIARDGRTVQLRQAIEEDAADLIRAVNSVAREGAYFLRSRFEIDEDKERAFIAAAIEQGDLMLIALAEGRLVGWVTIFRARPEFMRHTAELGMGVVRGYRGIGIGTALMDSALQWAGHQGLEKVNLGVRAGNKRARALYRKFGFVKEGHRVREIKDRQGRYEDSVEMAYFVSPHLPTPTDSSGETA